ncbi:hypothetical protein [Macrococcus brunensis]|uniref:hypothetical protein n=1 Tax=Macrococcus brunensis TaxID=198483 RepID=UPI001EF0B98D|nr:hypothetical protein [Macrococcus brunensis]ULG74011.1 hypothetical protein MGG13_10240 [Macrococcus brunensis]
MDYREALHNLNDIDLKYIYEQLFQEEAAELHQIELIESIRKEVFSLTYLNRILQLMPSDEYSLLMHSIEEEHEFVPVPSERVFFALQSLLMFETKQGMILPFDLRRMIKQLDKQDIEVKRQQLEQDLEFITGVLFLYGYVHRQHVEQLYKRYFNQELSEERLNYLLQLLGIQPVEDMIILPVIRDGFVAQELPAYDAEHYYVPENFAELKLYAGSHHHQHEEALNHLIDFIQIHASEEEEEIRELIDTARFLIIASNNANLTMEELINLFAKDLPEPQFEKFEQLFITALNETRLWIYGGKKLSEVSQEIEAQKQAEEEEKEKKVINLDVFRKDI